MASPAKIESCPVLAFAQNVLAGRIVAGRLVRLACQRHLDDLKHGHERGLKWDTAAAARAIQFFGFLRLPKGGELDGQAFTLHPFQQFIVGSLFGWKAADGFRRFRTAYVEQGKGSGKSPLAAGIGLYGLVADGEAAAEVFSAATKYDQAKILWLDAVRMVEASPSLRAKVKKVNNGLYYERTGSFFRPVSSEKRGLDGPRPHMVLIDELHEHPDAMVVDKMRAGTKARRQALIFEITNSGYDRTSVCWQHREFSTQVLEGLAENDSWFAYVCQLDVCAAHRDEGQTCPVEGCPDCDDWRDEAVWPKVNPGIDTILPRKYLREQAAEAEAMPAKRSIVLRLNFCIWTEAAVHAIPMDRWDSCKRPIDREALRGRECYAGIDIGSTSDFTSFCVGFPHDDGERVEVPADWGDPDGPKVEALRRTWTLLWWHWLPERPRRRDPYLQATLDGWKRGKLIRTTPGSVVDYDQVLRDILTVRNDYPFGLVAVDRGFQGAQFCTNLMREVGDEAVVAFPQGIVSMNAPFRELVELVMLGRLHHEGDPVTRWMASNCAAETRGGLVKPSKEHSKEKIDGLTAAVMMLGVGMAQPVAAKPKVEWF